MRDCNWGTLSWIIKVITFALFEKKKKKTEWKKKVISQLGIFWLWLARMRTQIWGKLYLLSVFLKSEFAAVKCDEGELAFIKFGWAGFLHL